MRVGECEARVCVRAFSGELCEGSSFVHRGAEGGGRSEGEREKEDWKKKGVRDMPLIERGGAVECTSEETQPLHLDFFQDWEQ